MSAGAESLRAGWIESALAGIGLATIVTDARSHIMFMNPVAESLTGWPLGEAVGRPLASVFRIESESTRRPVADPTAEAFATGAAVGLADHTVLIARDGRELRIDQGAAPVRDTAGTAVGAVLIFCDVSERQRAVQGVEDARALA